MSVPLTNAEIETRCSDMLIKAESIYPYYLPYLEYLYSTGSRPVESLRSDYVVSVTSDSYIVQPDKKNNLRIILFSNINNTYKSFLDGSMVYIRPNQYQKLNVVGQSLQAPSNYRSEIRDFGLYLFRYNYVRKLHDSGMSIEDIQIEMGWKNILMVTRYLTTNVYDQ
tara:strand:- start:938 stop:1438 length:501 start_codon:yes stop_codon:yes gene_type:complete